MIHYVDKPTTFVSTHISCGIYLMRPSIWSEHLEPAAKTSCNGSGHQLWLESAVFPQMASNSKLHALHTTRWWSQTKTPDKFLKKCCKTHLIKIFTQNHTKLNPICLKNKRFGLPGQNFQQYRFGEFPKPGIFVTTL